MARAHATVTGTEPMDGAILDAPPTDVVIRFNEPVSLTRAQILDPGGQDVLAPEAARSEQDGLHLGLPEDLEQGTYTVSYHVVSLDGHPVVGSLVFSLGVVSGAAQEALDAEEGSLWRWVFAAARAILYLALFGAAGGVIYSRLIRPGEAFQAGTQRIIAASALVGALAAVVTLGVQGGLLLGGPMRLLFEPATWAAGTGSTFGRTAICDLAGLALIWLGSRVRSTRWSGLLCLAGAFLAVAGFALSGHVVTAGPRWLTSPPLLLHATAAAFWVGSLLPLHLTLTGSPAEAGRLLKRFSALAVWAVAGLIGAGVALAWLQVRQPMALVTTAYGQVLLVKLALVAGLLGLAALNRLRLTPALVRGEADAPRKLGWSISGEVILVTGVLIATATLGTTPPPRALMADTTADPQDMHAHAEHGHAQAGQVLELQGAGFNATVAIQPGQVGDNVVTIALKNPVGQSLEVLEVSLRPSNPAKGIAPLQRSAERTGAGLWAVPSLTLGVAGSWDIELDVLISDFERQTASTVLTLR